MNDRHAAAASEKVRNDIADLNVALRDVVETGMRVTFDSDVDYAAERMAAGDWLVHEDVAAVLRGQDSPRSDTEWAEDLRTVAEEFGVGAGEPACDWEWEHQDIRKLQESKDAAAEAGATILQNVSDPLRRTTALSRSVHNTVATKAGARAHTR